MQIATKPLLRLTAGEIMSPVVVTIRQGMSVAEAAGVLSRASISGAPVVGAQGKCVGVISAADFVSWVREGQAPSGPAHRSNGDEAAGPDVGRLMTADPVTVGPDVLIGDMAQKLLDAGIHRVIVVDAQDRPIGIVSSTDIVAAVAYAARHLPAGVA